MPSPSPKPAWATLLEDYYTSGSGSFFILHGNVDDLIGSHEGTSYRLDTMAGFLGERLFGDHELVLHFDPGRGLRLFSGYDHGREKEMKKLLAGLWRGPSRPALEPGVMLRQLDEVLGAILAREERPPRTCLIFDYGELICSRTEAQPMVLATLLNWARNPVLKKSGIAVILLTTSLSLLHPGLVGSGYTVEIEVPMPGQEAREEFIAQGFGLTGGQARRIADLSSGLTLNNLETLLRLTGSEPLEDESGLSLFSPGNGQSTVKSKKAPPAPAQVGAPAPALDSAPVQDTVPAMISDEHLYELKKRLIESQCPGLIEFIKPDLNLDLVAGHQAAKERLFQDAGLIKSGELETVPMGYLICGPVGVGKTFIAMCYAGSVGLPCLVIRNFRSKYVGETEANLESILKILRELGPVAVIIDEADAMVGDRDQSGDSGTSQRVFGLLASQMGDTSYRGRIIWFLLTCRPDLLPVDLKRQGRCEEHIPLFYPANEEEQREMFKAMAAKLGLTLDLSVLPEFSSQSLYSGAEIESLLTRARREVILRGVGGIDKELLAETMANFNHQRSQEHEQQELAAILECTDLRYLPRHIREEIDRQGGMSAVSLRHQRLKSALSVF